MLKNYLVIAFRIVMKNRVFSLINVLGLSTGIACCVLISLYLQDELSFESGFSEHEKIFRINTTFNADDKSEILPFTSPPIAPALGDLLPEVERYTRLFKPLNTDVNVVTYRDRTFEKNGFLVDSTFLDVFSSKLREGDEATALDAPVVIPKPGQTNLYNAELAWSK